MLGNFWCQIVPVLAALVAISQQQFAEIEIGARGPCSFSVWHAKTKNISYSPAASFNPNEIIVTPERPVIPGCIKLLAKNVTIRHDIRHLTAEFEMRIGGTPDPNNPRIKCVKPLKEKETSANTCNCQSSSEDSCLICDFCKQMSKHIGDTDFKKNLLLKKAGTNDPCDCEIIKPGLYDLEAEMCTPTVDEIWNEVPQDVRDLVSTGQPLSIFTSIYLYDFDIRPLAYLLNSELSRQVLNDRKNKKMVGCYHIGTNIEFSSVMGR